VIGGASARKSITAHLPVASEFDTLRSMLRHVLLLQQRPDATSNDIEACRAALMGLVGPIAGLVNCHWGENIAPEERRGGFTHGFTMDFVDRASLEAYGPHPQHQLAVARVRATFDRIVVFDFLL
jgi:Stress responsive A/B Barrel Domain